MWNFLRTVSKFWNELNVGFYMQLKPFVLMFEVSLCVKGISFASSWSQFVFRLSLWTLIICSSADLWASGFPQLFKTWGEIQVSYFGAVNEYCQCTTHYLKLIYLHKDLSLIKERSHRKYSYLIKNMKLATLSITSIYWAFPLSKIYSPHYFPCYIPSTCRSFFLEACKMQERSFTVILHVKQKSVYALIVLILVVINKSNKISVSHAYTCIFYSMIKFS